MPRVLTNPDSLRGSRPNPQSERSFLRSRSQPKPRRNTRSRYAHMVESIHPRAKGSSSSDCGSAMTRRARSSSLTMPSSLTNPTTPYQDSDRGRLGAGFSILKPMVSRSQTSHAPVPKITALPPWLQDTITELNASHPLRAVFPVLHEVSDPQVVNHPTENPPESPVPPRHGVNRPFCFSSTPPRVPSSTRLPDPDTSSDELQALSPHYPLYQTDSLLHLRSRSPAPSIGALSRSEVGLRTSTDSRPGTSALTNMTKNPDICEFKTPPLLASSSDRDPHETVSPATQRDVECDDVFRYNTSQADLPIALPPSEPFVFERPTRVYFDSPIEDPMSSDPLEPNDYDPFRLDPEEYKNISFKWTPFDPQVGTRAPTLPGSETSAHPRTLAP
ncbi:hypothetical protein BJ322DRAFT_848106 [Thelephora terrestris]|uniref:Uncharacterized protein n=1 Tax=Thelephora terrestris TaxID=56493 RepID=A0A9P6HD12_9AGAM|nr:hypothetical protein BJ322DRAFT_848106 [Thelephora terrestris]